MKLTDPNVLTSSYVSGSTDLAAATGMARIFYTESDLAAAKSALGTVPLVSPFDYFAQGYLTVNLLVTQITAAIAEKSVITPHLGDKFSAHFFGKSPTVLQASAIMLNPYDDSHRAGMVSVYQHLLRLRQVALLGVVPNLSFVGCTIPGAMVGMTITEEVTNEGNLQVQFDWLAFKILVQSIGNLSTHKVEQVNIMF